MAPEEGGGGEVVVIILRERYNLRLLSRNTGRCCDHLCPIEKATWPYKTETNKNFSKKSNLIFFSAKKPLWYVIKGTFKAENKQELERRDNQKQDI